MNLISEGESLLVIEEYLVEFEGENFLISDVTDFASFQKEIRNQLNQEI